MTITPLKTNDISVTGAQKTLLYTHHGWGKTHQGQHFANAYGKGLIISGESGLRTLMMHDIDYLPFNSWDGDMDPVNNRYSFKGIIEWIHEAPEFAANEYQWIMVDSLSELAERCLEHAEAKQAKSGKKDGFAIWGDYDKAITSALKWIRDLPYHVLVTALAKESTNDNGSVEYWPNVPGNAVGRKLPGLFDNVLCGVRVTTGDRTSPEIRRYIVTEEVRGWHGKVRDPRQRLKPIEDADNIAELLSRIKMSDDAFKKYVARRTPATPAEAPTEKEATTNE